jgi:DNA-binding SARP family transcriptional activator
MRVLSGLTRLAGWLLARLVKAALLAAIVAGIPYGLLTQIGAPVPRQWPTVEELLAALTAPVPDTLVLHLLAAAVWLLWAAFMVCLLVEVAAAIRGVPAPRLRAVSPLQTLAGWLVAGVSASVLIAAPVVNVAGHATAAVATATAPSGTATATMADVPTTAAAARTPVAHVASDTLPGYEVARGDWMVKVAERFLGDEDRYAEIARLNPQWERRDHRFPDHWEPRWRVVLPADAHDRGPRPHATGQLLRPATPVPPVQQPPSQRPAQPHPGATASRSPAAPAVSPSTSPSGTASTPADPDGVVPEPTVPASPSASTAPPSSGAAGIPPSASPSGQPPATAPHTDDGHGVNLPGGWVGLPLAAALAAAAAMVWRRRRHRYVPRPVRGEHLDDPDLRPLPPVVTRLRHTVRERAPQLLDPPPAPPQPTVAEYANSDTEELRLPPVGPSGVDLAGLTDQVPAGGLGLTGPGAEPAARGLLVATLSTGSPTDPDARGHVVIPADALTSLLGAHSVEVGAIPRLTMTATLSDALTRVEELLIERRRQLQEYDAADLAELRAADPYHPPMPPVLLLAEVPPPELRARLSTTLHLGTALQISAVLLGEWPRGDTIAVHADGRTPADPQRLAVLDVPTTVQLLHVLREAHTGEPARPPQPQPAADGQAADMPAAAVPHHAPTDDTTAVEPADTTLAAAKATADGAETVDGVEVAGPAAEADPGDVSLAAPPRPGRRRPVRVRLLGEPAIFDRDGTAITGLRRHARQLLVHLAVHRDGADLPQIMEAFWPTATLRRAGERLSTEVADLRGRIRQAAGDDKIQPVINTGGRYVLNADLLDIDLWRMSDALRRAGKAADPAARITALREAVDVHTGGLADGQDYDWIEQPREQVRRHGVRARLHLADLLAELDPGQAAILTQAAADLDPYNEQAARHAMRTLARIGNAAGIRTRLQRLRDCLDEIDEEPSGETIALAAQLQPKPSGSAPAAGTTKPGDGQPTNSEPSTTDR